MLNSLGSLQIKIGECNTHAVIISLIIVIAVQRLVVLLERCLFSHDIIINNFMKALENG